MPDDLKKVALSATLAAEVQFLTRSSRPISIRTRPQWQTVDMAVDVEVCDPGRGILDWVTALGLEPVHLQREN
jgi:hypothetical protein